MLVLSRKVGEKIIIDGDLTRGVCLCWVNRVRLGSEAPKEVPIRRSELSLDSLPRFKTRKTVFHEGVWGEIIYNILKFSNKKLGMKDLYM